MPEHPDDCPVCVESQRKVDRQMAAVTEGAAYFAVGDEGGHTPEFWAPPPVDFPVVPQSANPKDRIGVTKPPLDLVPASLDIYVAEAFRDGAQKYGPFNWRETPVKASVYIAAARRHLAAWFDGEDEASDSETHHLAHAVASLAIILDAELAGTLVDDRPPAAPTSSLIRLLTRREAS
jgi:hypothetical protein